jgi:hypothetical protein
MSTATLTVPTSRTREGIVAVALTLGSLAVAIMLVWSPGLPNEDFSYADLAPVRDTAWAALLVDGLGFAVAGAALALAVCMLTRARGAVWANVGAVLTTIGGMAFFAAEFAFGTFSWYATALPADSGTQLITYVHDNSGHVLGVQAASFVAYNLGVLLMCVALWRARTVPRWLPVAIAVLTLAQFVMPSVLGRVEEAVTMLSFVPIGWYLMRGLP